MRANISGQENRKSSKDCIDEVGRYGLPVDYTDDIASILAEVSNSSAEKNKETLVSALDEFLGFTSAIILQRSLLS